jgi:hypothetical protein
MCETPCDLLICGGRRVDYTSGCLIRKAGELREEFERTEPRCVIVDVRGRDDLVGLRDFDELENAALDGFGRADDRAEESLARRGFFSGRPVGIDVVDGRWDLAGRAAPKVCEGLLNGTEKVARLGVGFGDDGVEAKHSVRPIELARWLELRAIELQSLHHIGRSEMRCKGEGQAEFGGKLCAEETRSEQPNGDAQARPRNGANFLVRGRRLKIGPQLLDVLGEVVGGGRYVAAQCARGGLICTGSAAEPEIDTVWIERSEGPELLGDDEGRMVWQHDPAGADADRFRSACHMADDDRCGGAGDAGHVVMLCQPKTLVAPDFSVLRDVERVAQSDSGCRSMGNGREIKNRKRNHNDWMPCSKTPLQKGILSERHSL